MRASKGPPGTPQQFNLGRKKAKREKTKEKTGNKETRGKN